MTQMQEIVDAVRDMLIADYGAPPDITFHIDSYHNIEADSWEHKGYVTRPHWKPGSGMASNMYCGTDMNGMVKEAVGFTIMNWAMAIGRGGQKMKWELPTP